MKKRFIFVLCVVTILLSGCNDTPDFILKNDSYEETSQIVDDEGSSPEEESDTAQIYVYICGAVLNPGVYNLDSDSRIYELVDAAGGFLEDADVNDVNLAESLTDGQMIRIYTYEETNRAEVETDGTESQTEGISSDGKVNINTATVDQLQTLSGIGQSKAEQIISYRESNGSFQSAEDIMNVSGIGEGTFSKIKDSISVQ